MCTSLGIQSKEGNYYWGRTQEFDFSLDYYGGLIPRGYQVKQTLTPFSSKYAALGIVINKHAMLADGVNENGLCGGTFYFGNYNKYIAEERVREMGKTPIRGEEICTWVLLNYASVADIREHLNQDVAVADTPGEFGISLPQHCVFLDESGDCVVIEPSLDGEFKIFDNPVGVMTNTPPFDWQMINLENYANLNSAIYPCVTMDKHEIFSPGKGSGLLGMPGDYSSASRFIRVAYLKYLADQSNDQSAVEDIFHILNSFDIPKGVVKTPGPLGTQTTHYTSSYDVKQRQCYVHLYSNRAMQTFKMDEKLFDSDRMHFYGLNYHQQIMEAPEIDG